MGQVALCKDAHIQGIAIALEPSRSRASGETLCHARATERSRQKAIGSRADIRIPLRPVDAEIAGSFIHFILHRIGRYDLDVAGDEGGRVRAEGDSMPRMRPKERPPREINAGLSGLCLCHAYQLR